ncbi:MAG: cytochrome-c peroxidase, partial [Nitrospinae bacterium]|nr:cytochrome-c peroxidase [Nitrospinota bacterium]
MLHLGRPWKDIWLTLGFCGLTWALSGFAVWAQPQVPPPLSPLPPLDQPKAEQVELGRFLFFDPRASGDGSLACASCHDPNKGWADGLPLSLGYPASLYFRNTPTVVNVAYQKRLYWDGRLADLPTLVRDSLTEAHFMNIDGRLLE